MLPSRIGDAERRVGGGRGSWVRRPAVAWTLLALAWWVLALLGIGALHDAGRSPADAAYGTLQLTLLDGGGDTLGSTRLGIARFLAPLTLALTLVQTWRSLRRTDGGRRLWRGRTDTVVCGGGTTGSHLVRMLTGTGERVVVVDIDPGAPGLVHARALGVPVLVGDATDPHVLASADVARARRLVAATGDDAVNARIASAAGSVDRHPAAGALRCTIRVEDAAAPALADVAVAPSTVDWFDVHDRAARGLLAEHHLPASGPGGGAGGLLVVGLGALGRAVVLAHAQRGALACGADPLPLTLVDPAATGRWAAMCLRHPRLPRACSPRLHDLDLGAPEPGALDRLRHELAERPPTCVVVTSDEVAVATAALALGDLAPHADVVAAVRASAAAVPGAGGRPRTFPVVERTWTAAALDGGARGRLATTLASIAGPLPTASADEVVSSLGAVGFALAPLRRWGDPDPALGVDDIERLALREHLRWCRHVRAQGWVHGDERDEAARREPLLVPWSELPRAARDDARARVRALPDVLAQAGLELRSRRASASR